MYIIIIILLVIIGLLLKKLNENKKPKMSSDPGKGYASANNTIDVSKIEEREVPLSKEEKRARANRKGWLFGCLPVSLIIIVLTVAVVIAESNHDEIMEAAVVEEKVNPFGLTTDSLEALVGEKVPYDKWPTWGSPQTLEGTNNFFYAAYLDSADVSFVSNKSNDQVMFAGFGRGAAKDYLLERQKRIEKQFSSYDGSHRNLERAVKKTMNDPDSFDHVSTEYYDKGDHLIVKMTFRGTNAFGGKVINNITVMTSLDGEILDVISQND